MSKFIKRLGTTASKYMVEFSCFKIELNLIQPCKIGLILKRGNFIVFWHSLIKLSGDHVEEIKKPVTLEKGVAEFSDKLGIPITLYFDKKKNIYITKEVYQFP